MSSKKVKNVLFRKMTSISESEYPGFDPLTSIIKKGAIILEGRQPIACDILCERDVAVDLRDGTTIYTDIFRPVEGKDLPAIVAWGPYGKRGGWVKNDLFPNRMDVPTEWEDGLNQFEGPNPNYWVNHGYAVIHTDPRGIFSSEGDMHAWGTQEAQDEYDLIEWVAKQEWSNGKVGLTGNSWLAMSQWNVAALCPPHLTAIAPWEGGVNPYRESLFKGGIPEYDFTGVMLAHLYGNNNYEDLIGMMEKYPLMCEYWEDKIPKLEQINVPAYVVASYTNVLHTYGTLDAWSRISSTEKWLRVHNTQEWSDYYNPENVKDLQKFFDYFLKNEENGWDKTPKVRLTVLDPGHKDILNRPEEDFPLKRQQYEKLYLDAGSGKLNKKMVTNEANISYLPNEGTSFTLAINQDTEIAGYIKLHLWVAAEADDDMDIFVYVRKLDSSGNRMPIKIVTNSFFEGAIGRLRVSLRQLDEVKSTPENPRYTFSKGEKLKPGEIVPIEIGIWPIAMKWHAGEQLEVRITGIEITKRPDFPDLIVPTNNSGKHIIYTGGKYDSYLLVPVIPFK